MPQLFSNRVPFKDCLILNLEVLLFTYEGHPKSIENTVITSLIV